MSDDEFPNNTQEWLDEFLTQLLVRPLFMTEVRRDGKDNAVIEELIRKEFQRRLALPDVKRSKFSRRYEIHIQQKFASSIRHTKICNLVYEIKSFFTIRMREYAAASWATCEQMHKLMLDDDQPENEKQRLVNDYWYPFSIQLYFLF